MSVGLGVLSGILAFLCVEKLVSGNEKLN